LWRQQGRLAEAAAQWRALLTEEPGLASARLALAEVCLAQGLWPEVEAQLARLEADAPDALDTLLLRGRAHLARRDFAAARQMFVRAGNACARLGRLGLVIGKQKGPTSASKTDPPGFRGTPG
jgi:tetratricopeptide (TPR) repeat protein